MSDSGRTYSFRRPVRQMLPPKQLDDLAGHNLWGGDLAYRLSQRHLGYTATAFTTGPGYKGERDTWLGDGAYLKQRWEAALQRPEVAKWASRLMMLSGGPGDSTGDDEHGALVQVDIGVDENDLIVSYGFSPVYNGAPLQVPAEPQLVANQPSSREA